MTSELTPWKSYQSTTTLMLRVMHIYFACMHMKFFNSNTAEKLQARVCFLYDILLNFIS